MGNASERRLSFLLSLDLGYSVFDLGYSAGSFLLDIPRNSVSSRFFCGLCALREILLPPVNGYGAGPPAPQFAARSHRHFGCRFSRKAATPSAAASVVRAVALAAAPADSSTLKRSPTVSLSICLVS